MHRIDGPTRAAALPAPAPVGAGNSSPGFFGSGDPLAGVPATSLTADWANAIQEEIAHTVESAGLALDKSDNHQLATAIAAIVAAALDQQEQAPSIVLAVPGKRVSADGYMELWGVSSMPTSESPFTLNFPFGGFPNACFGISATIINSNQTNDGQSTVQEVALFPDRATLYAQNHKSPTTDAAGGFRWRAWGH